MARKRFMSTSKILEALKPSEYNALSAINKERLAVIVSVGSIDVAEGQNLRATLLTLFPEGTESYDSLIEVMGKQPPLP